MKQWMTGDGWVRAVNIGRVQKKKRKYLIIMSVI